MAQEPTETPANTGGFSIIAIVNTGAFVLVEAGS